MLNWIEPAHEQAVHPFLYFSSQDVHRLREKAKTTHRDIFVRLRTAARRMKAEPSRFLPPTNWSVFASRWNEDHGNNFAALAMYCVLNPTDVQARNVAMQFFNAFVSLPNWRVSALIRDDVPVAHSLVAMATVYDFLFQHLKEDLRIKALAKISDVTKELYERSFKLAWGKQYIQNHVATNYVALFTGAIVVEPHIKEAKVWKERANFMLRRTMFLLDQIVDGSMEEGVAYGSYTTRSLTQYIFLAKRHLGTDSTNNIWLREHFWFLYHTILPSFTETVGIADSNQNWFYGPESQLVFLDSHVMRNGYGNWLAKKIRMLRVENSTMEGASARRFCTLHTEFIFYNASIPEKEPPNTSTPQLHVSISTDFQKSCEFLGYEGIARVDVGNKSPIIFKRRKHLHSSVFGQNSCRANVSKMSIIILFIWSIAIVILLIVSIESARRRVFKCNKRMCGPLFIFGMIFMWIFRT